MREVKINNRVFNIRGLTRKEIKSLKKYGFTYVGPNLSLETLDDAMDAAFEVVLTADEINTLDDLVHADSTLPIWNAILAETYGSKEEEKNLKTSGAGLQTATD